jgi:aspartate racemase
MKTIGLIGGMSWESTVTYYQVINREIKEKLGGFHSSKCILNSVDFHEIEECQSKGDWDRSAEILANAALNLEKAGADFVIICTNTMHKVAGAIKEKLHIPLLHIAEVTAVELLRNDITTVALLGTKYTMEQDFYKSMLIERNINVIIPREEDREFINHTIYQELCLGIINEASRKKLLSICDKLTEQGAQGIILGCTEIGLLITQEFTNIPLFDTTLIHAKSAARYSLEE